MKDSVGHPRMAMLDHITSANVTCSKREITSEHLDDTMSTARENTFSSTWRRPSGELMPSNNSSCCCRGRGARCNKIWGAQRAKFAGDNVEYSRASVSPSSRSLGRFTFSKLDYSSCHHIYHHARHRFYYSLCSAMGQEIWSSKPGLLSASWC